MSIDPLSIFSLIISFLAFGFSVGSFILVWRRDTKPDINFGFGEDYETSGQSDAPSEKCYYAILVNNSLRKVQIQKITIEWRKSWFPFFTKTKISDYKTGNRESTRKFWIEPWESKEFGNYEEDFLEQIDVNTKHNKSIWVNMAAHTSTNAIYRSRKLRLIFY